MAVLEPQYMKGNAVSEQRMIEEFFQAVKTYVDGRLEELGGVVGQATAAPGPRDITMEELVERFQSHAVNEQGMDLVNASRSAVMDLAFVWLNVLPPGRDKSLAYTALEEASFHATAAISRQKGNQS